MNQMEIFKNPEFGSVRVIEENGKYLFCGLDVTAALGYKDSAKALKAHCTSDGWAFYPLIDNVGRTQQTRFISEGNLYRLIVHSKLNCTPKVGQKSQRKGCRNLWEKNCSVRN